MLNDKMILGFATALSGSAQAAAARQSATDAAQSAADAAESANVAKGVEESLPEDYTQMSADVADLKSAMDTKADITGSYEGMTVGNAEQLVSTVGVTDNAPYLFRPAGGANDIGDRKNIKAIVGGNVAWNQMLKEMNSADFIASSSTGSSVSISDGVATVTVTAQYAGIINAQANRPSIPNGHKVFCSVDVKLSSAVSNAVKAYWNEQNALAKAAQAVTTWQTLSSVVQWNSSSIGSARVNDYRASDFDSYQVKNEVMIDLTLMFGSTIADYIYSLEQATPGAGVAWFRQYFPKAYYPYCAGSLPGVNASANVTTGFNQYNPDTGTAEVLGGMQYQITGTYTALSLDGDTVTPDASGHFTPAHDGALTVTGGNATDTCVHLVWDGSHDGEYAPYEAHTYALDGDLTLNGIPKLNDANQLVYDGDRYLPSGEVQRRYGVVTLNGSENWSFYRSDGSTALNTFQAEIGTGYLDAWGSATVNNLRCSDYIVSGDNIYYQYDKACAYSETSGKFYVCDAFTTVAAWESYLSTHPITVLCKLATPTTESADPYADTMIVDDFGTEQFVVTESADGVAVPVGHETVYQPNLRAKVEMAPNSPADGDGDYIVRQTGGVNEYVKLVMPDELPAAPTTDGTYHLKATVSGGTTTLTWEAD